MSLSTEYKSMVDLLSPNQYLNENGELDLVKLSDHTPLPSIYEGNQAIRVPNTFEPGYSSVYRNAHAPDFIVNRVHDSMSTLYEVFEMSVKFYGENRCLGKREFNKTTNKFNEFFSWETYSTVGRRRKNLGSGILNLIKDYNVETESDKFIVSIFSPNRPEWIISQLASSAYSLPTTALYDTLGPKTSEYILNFTKSPVMICSFDKIVKIIDLKQKAELKYLKFIISMDDLSFDEHYGLVQTAKSLGLILLDLKQVEKIGELSPIQVRPPKPEDLLCVSFTSGTTGMPKGVEVSHEMGSSAIAFCFALIEQKNTKNPNTNNTTYCFLPLAHIYELMTSNLALSKGVGIGFPHSTDPATLFENLKILKPDVVTLVPRVYNKIESALKDGFKNSFVGEHLIKKVVDYKTVKQLKDGHGDLILIDSIVTSKIKKMLGFDNVMTCICGSAPINPETASFVKAATGVGFKQGYGLTESFAGIAISNTFESDLGSSGPVGITGEMRLRDIPEMNYFSVDKNTGLEKPEPMGELLLRGPQIFKRYFKNEEETKKVLDPDGWFHTGDVAKIDKFGRVYIIDRFKNFFKLSQGEYITPERIENIYSSCCPMLTQIFVHGDSFKTFLVAIVGIEPNSVKTYFKRHGKHFKKGISDEELLAEINSDTGLKKKFLDKVNSTVKDEGLQGFEKIHNLKVFIEPLKIENDVITPTLKLKRNIASKFFAKDLEELYKEGSLIKQQKL